MQSPETWQTSIGPCRLDLPASSTPTERAPRAPFVLPPQGRPRRLYPFQTAMRTYSPVSATPRRYTIRRSCPLVVAVAATPHLQDRCTRSPYTERAARRALPARANTTPPTHAEPSSQPQTRRTSPPRPTVRHHTGAARWSSPCRTKCPTGHPTSYASPMARDQARSPDLSRLSPSPPLPLRRREIHNIRVQPPPVHTHPRVDTGDMRWSSPSRTRQDDLPHTYRRWRGIARVSGATASLGVASKRKHEHSAYQVGAWSFVCRTPAYVPHSPDPARATAAGEVRWGGARNASDAGASGWRRKTTYEIGTWTSTHLCGSVPRVQKTP
ncbi:hypothetical protein DFH06DRAFT_275084 [Mycena polygramma]|nr:hypothetical protein DFH06DRAFT_275084 [Mycena polygramma]